MKDPVDYDACDQAYSEGRMHGLEEGEKRERDKVRDALLRLNNENKGAKWSADFVMKFLGLDSSLKAGDE